MKIKEAIKQEKFASNVNMAIVNIFYTNNWLHDQHKDFFAKYKLKAQHYNVLRILKGRYPDAASPGEIKDVMIDKSPDLTRLIDKLVNMNLVERNMCPQNRRKVDVYITKNGVALLKLINDEMEELNNLWKSRLSEEEAAKLSDLLDKLRV